MKTANDWAEATYDLVSIRCKDVWHMPEVRALFAECQADARREALVEVLKIARGTKEDGYTLAMKAHAAGDEDMARSWRGEAEGAAEIERDIMNLLGIDWANGETDPA